MSYSRMLSLFCFFCLFMSFVLTGYHLFPSRAVADQDETDIARLVKQLGSDDFREREAAIASLRKIGKKTLPALRAAQRSKDLEIRRRASMLVQELDEGIQPLLNNGAKILYYGNQLDSPTVVNTVSMDYSSFKDNDLINVREFTNMRVLILSGA